MVRHVNRRVRFAALVGVLALCASLLPGTAAAVGGGPKMVGAGGMGVTGGAAATNVAGGDSAPGECPTIMPVADVETGMRGRGWTVEQGRNPEPFRVEILGVLDDAIAPDKDLIVVEVSDVAGSNMLGRVGGIWAGMSGSPVYVDGRLLGAVAYGFSLGPSLIGGVTPAEDMARILRYGSDAAAQAAALGADRIALPSALQAEIARRTGATAAQASGLERLPTPLAVSGLSTRARDVLQRGLDRAGYNARVVSGSTAAAPSGTPRFRTPVPGGNFASVISYGDFTAAGIGTTTYVCDGQALAFGHPFTFRGRVGFGANDANAITIIDDPTLTPYKLANIDGLFGTTDQDRLSGLGADLGNAPERIPISSRVRALDLGTVRDGQSASTSDEFVPFITLLHLLSNLDVTIDRVGPGTSKLKWTIEGRRANGDPWSLTRSNRYASQFDISGTSVGEIFEQLAVIESNQFEDISFESVSVRARVARAYQTYSIENVRVSKNGGPFRSPEVLTVRPGMDLTIRTTLRAYRADTRRVDLQVRVPDSASGEGVLSITGGTGFGGGFGSEACLFDHAACAAGGGGNRNGFDRLLDRLRNGPRNNDLTASLEFFSFEGPSIPTVSDTDRLDRVVDGLFEFFVVAPFEG